MFRLAGPTCLAGDVIGDYDFDRPLQEGDLVLLGDMAIYTTCKQYLQRHASPQSLEAGQRRGSGAADRPRLQRLQKPAGPLTGDRRPPRRSCGAGPSGLFWSSGPAPRLILP